MLSIVGGIVFFDYDVRVVKGCFDIFYVEFYFGYEVVLWVVGYWNRYMCFRF